jgi:hypothetical protein
MPTNQFSWTANEIQTKQGFYVAPGNKNPNSDEAKFLVLRYTDERSSKLCQTIDNMARSSGGIVIYDESAISRGLSSGYRTSLFHDNCRCRLIPKPDSIQDEVISDIDLLLSVSGALSESEKVRLKHRLSEKNLEKYNSREYQYRIRRVMDINASGFHQLHDRRGRFR